jgi:hypothetical protein
MEAVDVFVRAHGIEDALLADLTGKGELDEDAVDRVVGVEAIEKREELGFARRLRERVEHTADPDFGRCLLLVPRVDVARGIVADENDLEAWRATVRRGELSDAAGDLRSHFGR